LPVVHPTTVLRPILITSARVGEDAPDPSARSAGRRGDPHPG
jgi:hypothetical protein